VAEHTVALTVDNGCYHLVDPVTTQRLLYHTGTNGLVGVLGDGAACVCTGTLTGYIRVTVLPAQEPPATDLAAWDDIVEVSFTALSGRLRPASPEATLLPNLASAGAGTYRLRVHARGRDTGYRAETVRNVDQITEEHLIISWPDTSEEPETIIQTKDTFGAGLRAHPSDPSTMPLPDPMNTGGVDMSADSSSGRVIGMNQDPNIRIRFR
jgi:hypothetical protein